MVEAIAHSLIVKFAHGDYQDATRTKCLSGLSILWQRDNSLLQFLVHVAKAPFPKLVQHVDFMIDFSLGYREVAPSCSPLVSLCQTNPSVVNFLKNTLLPSFKLEPRDLPFSVPVHGFHSKEEIVGLTTTFGLFINEHFLEAQKNRLMTEFDQETATKVLSPPSNRS